MKIALFILSSIFAIDVIYRVIMGLHNNYKDQKRRDNVEHSCTGCRYLYLYNDGSPFCEYFKTDSIDNPCLKSDFLYKDKGKLDIK